MHLEIWKFFGLSDALNGEEIASIIGYKFIMMSDPFNNALCLLIIC